MLFRSKLPDKNNPEIFKKIDAFLAPYYNMFRPGMYEDHIGMDDTISKRITLLFAKKADWDCYLARKDEYRCKEIADMVAKAIPLFEELQKACESEEDREHIKANLNILNKFMEEEVKTHFAQERRPTLR